MTSILLMLTGYDQESHTMTGLEEYWNYSVTVTAITSKGSNISDMVSQRTLPAGIVVISRVMSFKFDCHNK